MEMETGFGSSNQYELASELSKKMWYFNLLFVSQMDPFRKEKNSLDDKMIGDASACTSGHTPERASPFPRTSFLAPARFVCLHEARAARISSAPPDRA
jgi:hypothetical protein